jgi:peptidoglycan/xylan/chitin deacetylase (PgdA/CDA1 family)
MRKASLMGPHAHETEGRLIENGRTDRGGEILNLCFHGIGTPGRELEPDEELYWLDYAQFEELLELITKYPSIRVTFDDGNASDIALAMPALRQRNLNAAFFIISGRLDQPGSLASAEVRSLVRDGMTVGSHGMWHRPWPSANDQELEQELTDAAAAIAEAAGRPVRQVACPFGSYDRRVLSAIRRHGFCRVYTVDGGSARSGAWLQARYAIRAADTPADIERRARSPRGSALSAAVRTAKSFVKRWR